MSHQTKTEILPESVRVRQWFEKLERAKQVYEPYIELIKHTREQYKSAQNETNFRSVVPTAYNIFWSSVETQKPFLYFKRPKPWVDRVNKMATIPEQVACKILERALDWSLAQFDFDSVAKYARNDYLISGMGLLFETYQPVFQSVELGEGETNDVIEKEMITTRYWDPCHFLADTDKVGVWEDVTWIARRMYLTPHEVELQFGAEALEKLRLPTLDRLKEKSVCVYEIWDKTSKTVLWFSPQCMDSFLKEIPDPYGLEGFFPCPKPIFATLTNDGLIPVPDYTMIRRMIDELNGITERMRLTMQAIKVSGVYDGAFHRLSDIFEKDVTLVSISDFDRLKASGGIRGVIDFIPIEQYILALEQLAKRRDDVVKRIFEITGVSDIMRGSSNERETATAVEKKTNFGTLRNQDRQNDMQRFLADLYRIKADMICTCFMPDTLAGFVNISEGYTENVIQEAVHLLKTDKLRGMLLHVESTGIVNTQEEILRTTQGVQILQDLLKDAMSFVSAQPLLLPIYKQMMMTVIGQMPQARSFESVLDQTFSHIKTDLEKPDMQGTEQMQHHTQLTEHQMRMENQALEQQLFERKLSVRKLQQEYELTKEKNAIEREKNLLKQRELDMKEHETQE